MKKDSIIVKAYGFEDTKEIKGFSDINMSERLKSFCEIIKTDTSRVKTSGFGII